MKMLEATPDYYEAPVYAPIIEPEPDSWKDRGACANDPDPDLWFGTTTSNEVKRADRDRHESAKIGCDACPVWQQCRIAGLLEDEGTWGGLAKWERQAIAARYLKSKSYPARMREAARLRQVVREADDAADIVTQLPAHVRTQRWVHDYETTHWGG